MLINRIRQKYVFNIHQLAQVMNEIPSDFNRTNYFSSKNRSDSLYEIANGSFRERKEALEARQATKEFVQFAQKLGKNNVVQLYQHRVQHENATKPEGRLQLTENQKTLWNATKVETPSGYHMTISYNNSQETISGVDLTDIIKK